MSLKRKILCSAILPIILLFHTPSCQSSVHVPVVLSEFGDHPCNSGEANCELSKNCEYSTDCVQNAYCNDDNECACYVTHAAIKGRCVTKGKLSEPCGTSKPCHAELGLQCVAGICECLDDHIPTEDGKHCMRLVLESCSESEPCRDGSFLKCSPEGTCICENPETQWYNPYLKECMNLAGTHCVDRNSGDFINYITPSCVPGAECTRAGKCRCTSGFLMVQKTRQCIQKAGFGQNCSSQRPCDDAQGLTCDHGKCVCATENLEYDKESNFCKSEQQEVEVTNPTKVKTKKPKDNDDDDNVANNGWNYAPSVFITLMPVILRFFIWY